MRDLERATGVSRDTIRFYIREGLLPQPERPGRNSAWYDTAFVARVRFVRELREKRFLPLTVIKAIVTADDAPPPAEVRTLLALDGQLFPAVDGAPRTPPARLADVARRSGLAAAELRRLAAAGALAIETRDGDAWLDETAQHVATLWARLRKAGYAASLGFGPENLRLYVETVERLARQELRLFTAGVTGRVSTERAARMAEHGITLVNELLCELRRTTLLRLIGEGNVPTGRAGASPPVASSRRAG